MLTPELTAPDPTAPDPIASVGWATAIGRRRTVNEDAVFVGSTWFAIADGMGGHRAGDVASTLAIDVLRGFDGVPASTDRATIDTVVRRAIHQASYVVHRAATGPRGGMGTTLVGAVLVDDGSVAVFNIGDSRCYRFRDGSLTVLTTDHTHVRELVDAGRLHPDRARCHPMRHVLTRAVGVDPDVTADVHMIDRPTGRLLLCSDGVSSHLDHRVIAAVLGGTASAQQAADDLIRATTEAMAPDDASAIVIDPVPFDGSCSARDAA